MQVSTKGQVTIPQEIRERLGLFPHTKVEFEISGDHARIRKVKAAPGSGRGAMLIKALWGSARGPGMSTDEIMELTRGERRPVKRRK